MEDIIRHIYLYCSVRDYSNLSRVSKTWNKALGQDWFWRQLFIQNFYLTELPHEFTSWKSFYEYVNSSYKGCERRPQIYYLPKSKYTYKFSYLEYEDMEMAYFQNNESIINEISKALPVDKITEGDIIISESISGLSFEDAHKVPIIDDVFFGYFVMTETGLEEFTTYYIDEQMSNNIITCNPIRYWDAFLTPPQCNFVVNFLNKLPDLTVNSSTVDGKTRTWFLLDDVKYEILCEFAVDKWDEIDGGNHYATMLLNDGNNKDYPLSYRTIVIVENDKLHKYINNRVNYIESRDEFVPKLI